jgi:hypothetical protein
MVNDSDRRGDFIWMKEYASEIHEKSELVMTEDRMS